MSAKLAITIERLSVCAWDDVDAPHAKRVVFEPAISVAEALKKICALGYFPCIEGGKATWLAIGKKPLAVLAEEWPSARLLVDPSAKLVDHLDDERKIVFDYLAQESPEIAFAREKKKRPNKAPEPTTTAVTIRAPSSTARASRGRGSS